MSQRSSDKKRQRQESQQQQEHQDAQTPHEAQARLAAERSAAHAALAPVEKDQRWDKAQPSDIATAHDVATSWKDHDPAALAASEKISQVVFTRYGIDTHDVGADAAYLESGIQTITTEKARQDELDRSQAETRKAAAEHGKAMQLLAAARAEELRAQAADAIVKERLFLIGKDGINGPDIDQLRKETTANVNGAGDAHFEDPAFVKAATDMHEARLLAEAGVMSDQWEYLDQRYERAEKGLFARMESVGREIENRVTGNESSRLKVPGLKAESTSAAEYGSAEHHEKFAESVANTGANETQIRGRLAAARGEGIHPSAAVTMGKGAAKARKSRTGAAVGSERSKNGLTR